MFFFQCFIFVFTYDYLYLAHVRSFKSGAAGVQV